MEINLTVESNSEAGLVDIQQIRSDRFQFSICLSRATVFVKKLANKYYNEILPGDSKKITRSHQREDRWQFNSSVRHIVFRSQQTR